MALYRESGWLKLINIVAQYAVAYSFRRQSMRKNVFWIYFLCLEARKPLLYYEMRFCITSCPPPEKQEIFLFHLVDAQLT